MIPMRPVGEGWLVLLGGGEFTFGETLDADEAWLAKAGSGTVGFLPTASGSDDYGRQFTGYLEEEFDRVAETIPVYRPRDARRGRNVERIADAAAVYLGAGIADRLIETVEGTPVAEALLDKLRAGGTVVAIAGAAQALGQVARSIAVGKTLLGLGWLPFGVIEPNFNPEHDRRLRKLLTEPGVRWGLGLPADSALFLGPRGVVESRGPVFRLDTANGDLVELTG
ncbi:MAG: Type 1 glutamine amidotransferase-like domain-containing protein [Acidobacteriota bacterium]